MFHRLIFLKFPKKIKMAAHVSKIIYRGLTTEPLTKSPLQEITVIGAGIIGSGIAQLAATLGQKVTLVDIKKPFLNNAQTNIETDLKKYSNKLYKDDSVKSKEFVESALGNVSFSLDVQESVKTADLVIEAIMEHLPSKLELFTMIDLIAPENTIFASCTSSCSIANLAKATKRQDRFGGLHFFHPVPKMKLLEVVRTRDTARETYEHLVEFGNFLGKTCVTCKDTPGYIVNRLLIPMIADAIRMREKGIASAVDIDIAMKLGAGHPMGPFEIADLTGLDTAKYILDGWHQTHSDVQQFEPVATVNKLVSQGKFGVKSGEGFYKYSKK